MFWKKKLLSEIMYNEIISLPANDASLVLREMYADG